MNQEFSDEAIDALIAASLRDAYSSDSPSEAAIEAAMKAATTDEPHDAARLQRILEKLSSPQEPKRRQISGQLMAMNRKNDADEFDEPTKSALDEARKKAIEELLNEEEQEQEKGGHIDDLS